MRVLLLMSVGVLNLSVLLKIGRPATAICVTFFLKQLYWSTLSGLVMNV